MAMIARLRNVTYRGPLSDDKALLPELPMDLANTLASINGFVQFDGGIHVRGICTFPEWHSLRAAWLGASAFHAMYTNVRGSDIPFAQDCVGDQFLLREGAVWRLSAETGELQPRAPDLNTFLNNANSDPVGYLSLEPLLRLQAEGVRLEPGELIHVYPPFCTKEAAQGVSVRAVPALEVINFHAEFAAALPAEGGRIRVTVTD